MNQKELAEKLLALADALLKEQDSSTGNEQVDRLKDILRQAIARVKLANAEGDPILSAWLPSAEEALGD